MVANGYYHLIDYLSSGLPSIYTDVTVTKITTVTPSATSTPESVDTSSDTKSSSAIAHPNVLIETSKGIDAYQ